MSKSSRQALIHGLLQEGPIASQSRIGLALERGGFTANQATISRDLKELGVIKTAQGYALPGSAAKNGKSSRSLRLDHVYQVAVSGSFVVLRTPPAMAHPTAIELDSCDLQDVVGTIAGDDTVFVATPDERRAKTFAKRLRQLLSGPSSVASKGTRS